MTERISDQFPVKGSGAVQERPESEITALLTRMFELPSQLDEGQT
jgi:hypothetical protein